jgi:hypothetical protein
MQLGEAGRRLLVVELATAAQTALVIAHFSRGASIYEDPSRYHVVLPAIAAFVVTVAVAVFYERTKWPSVLWAVALAVGLPFVGVFGVYHGGFSHSLKLALFFAGMAPARLADLFDSPDFAMPNDALFEATGVGTMLLGIAIAWLLARFVRAARMDHGAGQAAPRPAGRPTSHA